MARAFAAGRIGQGQDAIIIIAALVDDGARHVAGALGAASRLRLCELRWQFSFRAQQCILSMRQLSQKEPVLALLVSWNSLCHQGVRRRDFVGAHVVASVAEPSSAGFYT